MVNVKGRVVNKSGEGIPVYIEIVTFTGTCQERILKQFKSDDEGFFEATYSNAPNNFILRFYNSKNLIQVIEISDPGQEIDLGEIYDSLQNIAIEGRVVDEENQPISGLMITAYDVDIGPDDFLGCAWTDVNGRYFIFYSTSRYHYRVEDTNLGSALNPLKVIKNSMSMLDRDPDIVVKVYDTLGVFELFKTDEHSDVKDIVKVIKDIKIPRSWVEGWHVTLDDSEPSNLTHDNYFEPLVDNENALKKILGAIDHAKEFIYLTQFEFRPDFMAQPDIDGVQGVTLGEKLIESSKRGVKVRVLINQNLLIPDDYDEIAELFQNTPVKVRPFILHPIDWDMGQDEIVGAEMLHHILKKNIKAKSSQKL